MKQESNDTSDNVVDSLKKQISDLQQENSVLRINQNSTKLFSDELVNANISLKTRHQIVENDVQTLLKENRDLKFQIKELTKKPLTRKQISQNEKKLDKK